MKNRKRRKAFIVNCIETLLGVAGIFAGLLLFCLFASLLLRACGVG